MKSVKALERGQWRQFNQTVLILERSITHAAVDAFANAFSNEAISTVHFIQRHLKKEVMRSTNNEEEAISVGFALNQFVERHITNMQLFQNYMTRKYRVSQKTM